MSDPVNDAKAAVETAVQKDGPEAVGFIAKYWPYFVGAIVLLVLAHFVF